MSQVELDSIFAGDAPFQDRPFITAPRLEAPKTAVFTAVHELLAEAVQGEWMGLWLEKVALDHAEVAGSSEQAECPFSRCVVMRCDAQSRSNALEEAFGNDVSSVTVQFVKRIVSILGPDSMSVITPWVAKFVDSQATRQQQCTAAELVAGMIRGSRQWGQHSAQSQNLLPLMQQALNAAPTIDTVSE